MLQQPARGYHENIVDHYENPRNVGSLDKNDPNVGTVGAPVCCPARLAWVVWRRHSMYGGMPVSRLAISLYQH